MIVVLDKLWMILCWLPLINLCIYSVGHKVGISQRMLILFSYCGYWIASFAVGIEFCYGWGKQRTWRRRMLMIVLLFVLIFELLELYFNVALWTYCRKYFGFSDFHLSFLTMMALSVAVSFTLCLVW